MDIYKQVFDTSRIDNSQNSEKLICQFKKKWDSRIKYVITFTKDNEKESVMKLLLDQKDTEYIELLKKLNIVTEFPDSLLSTMKCIYVGKKSLYQHFLDYSTRGHCVSMSTALLFAFPSDVNLYKGIIQTPLLNFQHQWLEHNDKIYDTTRHLVFPIKYYYEIFNPLNVKSVTLDEIEQIKTKPLYEIEITDPINKIR